ncbi:MAG TPA: diadenylate cyclase, partial [Planctomycetota bacterium]|nr:diadenylate cyclase [Planctomycetota bacterium]
MAQFGAILVFIDSQNINDPIFQGGFDINCNFAPEKLYELAKMDGAIILDLEAQKILKANVHLLPDQK